MIGIFPVVSQTPDRLIAGFNDPHLDFRVVIDVTGPGASGSHRDDAGQDAQLVRPDLSRDHHAVSPADRACPACVRVAPEALANRIG
jgi:hypothetical protein